MLEEELQLSLEVSVTYIGGPKTGAGMNIVTFLQELDERVVRYDLLRHPFYRAWSAGELSREDLAEYSRDYYHHVAAFPSYLKDFDSRLQDEEMRRAVEANMADESGGESALGQPEPSHSELWLDFVRGVGGGRELESHEPMPAVKRLIDYFADVASKGTPEQALAAFYAYESQVPRVAQEKAHGLRVFYGADERTCEYFRVHITADVYHSQVWRNLLKRRVEQDPAVANLALNAAEAAAQMLWQALDGIEARRLVRA